MHTLVQETYTPFYQKPTKKGSTHMHPDYAVHDKKFILSLKGDYVDFDDANDKRTLFEALKKASVQTFEIDGTDLKKWDSTLVIFLIDLIRESEKLHLKTDTSKLPDGLARLIKLSFAPNIKPPKTQNPHPDILTKIGTWAITVETACAKGYGFIQKTLASLGRLVTRRAVMRRVDFLFALQDCGPKAVLIVSLISFMVGLILAFVGAIQLKLFGAQVFVASLVAIGMTRIMGAIMCGIIMAGRTGASYAAAIGTMQVNEEIDALKTMGIPTTDFLVLPRVLALVITMPILTLLADAMGIIGGMAVGTIMLDIPLQEYWKYTNEALNLRHFWVGIFHGFIFGIIIALCGCYYGVNSGRDADSVGKATTEAVVSSIVWMIVATGIITWIFMQLGI